jgi:hypothetical protein
VRPHSSLCRPLIIIRLLPHLHTSRDCIWFFPRVSVHHWSRRLHGPLPFSHFEPAHRHVSYILLGLFVCSQAFIGSQLKKKFNISSNSARLRLNRKTKVVWIMDFNRMFWNSTNNAVRIHVLKTWTTGFGLQIVTRSWNSSCAGHEIPKISLEIHKACSEKDRTFAIKTILQHFKHCLLQSSPLYWRYTVPNVSPTAGMLPGTHFLWWRAVLLLHFPENPRVQKKTELLL